MIFIKYKSPLENIKDKLCTLKCEMLVIEKLIERNGKNISVYVLYSSKVTD